MFSMGGGGYGGGYGPSYGDMKETSDRAEKAKIGAMTLISAAVTAAGPPHATETHVIENIVPPTCHIVENLWGSLAGYFKFRHVLLKRRKATPEERVLNKIKTDRPRFYISAHILPLSKRGPKPPTLTKPALSAKKGKGKAGAPVTGTATTIPPPTTAAAAASPAPPPPPPPTTTTAASTGKKSKTKPTTAATTTATAASDTTAPSSPAPNLPVTTIAATASAVKKSKRRDEGSSETASEKIPDPFPKAKKAKKVSK
jgi:hypothetical protein